MTFFRAGRVLLSTIQYTITRYTVKANDAFRQAKAERVNLSTICLYINE